MNSDKKKAFTLIETLMALTVIIVGAVGAFIIVSRAIRISPVARQEIIASNLAQEGIEIIRNIRDNRILSIGDEELQGNNPVRDWSGDLRVCGLDDSFGSHFEIIDKDDITSGWEMPNCAVNRFEVFIEPTTGFLTNLKSTGPLTGWEDTGFRRQIEIAKFTCSDPPACTVKVRDDACTDDCFEVFVKVMVYWNSDVQPATCPSDFCLVVEDRLTNWLSFFEFIL